MQIVTTFVTPDEGLAACDDVEIGPRGAGRSAWKHMVAYGERPWDRCAHLKIRRRANGDVECRYGKIGAARISDYGTCNLVTFILAYGFDASKIGHRSTLTIPEEE